HWDLKLWVETPREVCLSRGLALEHLPPDRVLRVWRDIWQPREEEYIDEVHPIQTADIVIDGTAPIEDQIGA
ncbi:MAG: hypothetical protein ACRDQZ_03895, partial [Mycobacteriales bacterium]